MISRKFRLELCITRFAHWYLFNPHATTSIRRFAAYREPEAASPRFWNSFRAWAIPGTRMDCSPGGWMGTSFRIQQLNRMQIPVFRKLKLLIADRAFTY